MHELPLVFFTVLAQMAAGTLIISSIYQLGAKNQITLNRIRNVNVFAFFILLIALVFSFFHLGHPARAFNVLFGIVRSPMSNEIMIFSTLVGLAFVSVVLELLNRTTKWDHSFLRVFLHKTWLTRCVAILLILFSIFTVWAIILVYQIDTIPTWNTPFTSVEMITTALMLGGATAVLFGFRTLGLLFFIIGVFAVWITKLAYIDFLNEIAPSLTQAQYPFWISEIVLLIIAFFIMIWMAIRKHFKWYFSSLVLLLVLIAALCARIAFYNVWKIPMS